MKLQERANVGLHPHIVEKIKSLQSAKDQTIVDVGCGSGAMLDRLSGLGYAQLVGLDIAPPPSRPGISFIECDLDDCRTPLADGSVALIVSVEVLEHIENLGSLFSELARILRPDGAILATTPNVHSVEARLRFLCLGQLKQFDALGDPTHIAPIFQFPLRRTLQRHGLVVAQTWGFPLDGSSPTSRRGLRLAARALGALGVRGTPSGDQLCLLIRKQPLAGSATSKRVALTSHYQT